MATIVHRRPAQSLGLQPARGPGGSIDTLTWIGYASLVAAFGFLVFGLRPIAEMGDPATWDWNQVASRVIAALRDASVVLLPAALELGVPGARRLAPWLMRGTVLLAVEQLSRPLLDVVRTAFVEGQVLDATTSFATPGWVALTLVGFGFTLVGIAGAWSLSDGLADAGGRVRRSLLAMLVLGGTLLVAAAYLPLLSTASSGDLELDGIVLLVSNIASIGLGLVDNALWLVIGARLVAGLVRGVRPRTAWAIGALAGGSGIVVRVSAPLLFGSMQSIPWLGWIYTGLATAIWVLLALALAMGLGRGRERRRARPRRMHLFILNPTS